jgi:hypothetical protein
MTFFGNAQNLPLKSPRSTTNSPQTHHELTTKKHDTFGRPPSKSPAITAKNPPPATGQKKSQKQVRRRYINHAAGTNPGSRR